MFFTARIYNTAFDPGSIKPIRLLKCVFKVFKSLCYFSFLSLLKVKNGYPIFSPTLMTKIYAEQLYGI